MIEEYYLGLCEKNELVKNWTADEWDGSVVKVLAAKPDDMSEFNL